MRRRINSVDICACHLVLDDRDGMSQASAMETPGSKEAAISAARAAGGQDQTILSSSEHQDDRSMACLCQYTSEIRLDITFATTGVMRGAWSLALQSVPQESGESQDISKDDQHGNSFSDGEREKRDRVERQCSVSIRQPHKCKIVICAQCILFNIKRKLRQSARQTIAFVDRAHHTPHTTQHTTQHTDHPHPV